MTRVRTFHDQITTALERNNSGKAIALTSQMTAESESVSELIDEFEAAIQTGNRSQARTIRRQLERRFRQKQTADELLVKGAKAAIESGELSERQRTELQQTIQVAADATQLRSGFLSLAGIFLARLDEPDDFGSLTKTGSALQNRERQLEAQRQQTEKTVEDTPLPAQLEFVDTNSRPTTGVDSPATLDITIRNFGDEPVNQIDLTVNEPEEITANLGTSTLSTLEPNASETVELTLANLAVGEHQFSVGAQSPDTDGVLETFVVTVEEIGEPDALIRAFTGPDQNVRFEDVIQGIAHYNEGTTIPTSDTKRLSLDEVIWLIEEYNTDV